MKMGRRVIIVLLYPQLNGSLPLPAYDAETMEAPPLTLILVTFPACLVLLKDPSSQVSITDRIRGEPSRTLEPMLVAPLLIQPHFLSLTKWLPCHSH